MEKSRIRSVSSTILGCQNSVPEQIISISEISQPIFNSSENTENLEVEVFSSQSKVEKKGCHVCRKIFMKNNVQILQKVQIILSFVLC